MYPDVGFCIEEPYWNPVLRKPSSNPTTGALIITYTILAVPYNNYSIMGPKAQLKFVKEPCRVISRITRVVTHLRGLITPLITIHEPPSTLPTIGQVATSRASRRSPIRRGSGLALLGEVSSGSRGVWS